MTTQSKDTEQAKTASFSDRPVMPDLKFSDRPVMPDLKQQQQQQWTGHARSAHCHSAPVAAWPFRIGTYPNRVVV